MILPTLYKKTSTGAIQYWKITATEYDAHGIVETEYGQLDTPSPQITSDLISKGKNIGKKNETTAGQQAEAEALAKWEKQKKKGYVDSIEKAQAGKLDALIEGGVVPMLAHKFSEQGHKIKYPAYVQPKLDGIRCIAILDKDGKCTLWSRTRKQITSMPHIIKEIESLSIIGGVTLDGELYNHEYKDNFETIVSLVRQEEPDKNHEIVQYHIYDWVDDYFEFDHRWRWIDNAWSHITSGNAKALKLVETKKVSDESEAMEFFQHCKGLGYEGAMIRNAAGQYANKRSYDLQKIKEFEDAEFHIVGIEEGRGKLQGHVGAFVCRTDTEKTFLAKMSGDTSRLKEYFVNHSLWKGKLLTVQYQGLTGAEKVPRFPVGISIRDYE